MRTHPRPAAGLAALLLALAGCSGSADDPKTYPVSGRVVFEDGTPLAGGLVEFRAEQSPALICNGVLDREGKFALQTRLDNRTLPGAVAGSHAVSVTPRIDGDQAKQAAARPYVLAERYTVREQDNAFTITLKRQR